MITKRELLNTKKNIEYLKDNSKSCKHLSPKRIDILSDNWVLNESKNIYEYSLVHNCNVKLEELNIKFFKNNESTLMPFKYINENEILLSSDQSTPLLIIIFKKNEMEVFLSNRVNLSDYYTKDEVYSKNESYSKEQMYNKNQTYNRNEIYSSDEVYPKSESYSISELYTKDELLNKEQAEKEISKIDEEIVKVDDSLDQYKKWDTLYGKEDLSPDQITVSNFYESKYNDMFRKGPLWLYVDGTYVTNGGLSTLTHNLFPEIAYNDKCYGICVEDMSTREYYLFCEIDKNYNIVKQYRFKSDTLIWRETHCSNQTIVSNGIYADTSYKIYKNKAYIVNAFNSNWSAKDRQWHGFITVHVVNLDTFECEKTFQKEYAPNRVVSWKTAIGFMDFIVSDAGILIFSDLFKEADAPEIDYREDASYLGSTLFSLSGNLIKETYERIQGYIYNNLGTVSHGDYSYFFCGIIINKNNKQFAKTIVKVYNEKTLKFVETVDIFEEEGLFWGKHVFGMEKCFDYYMYNEDGTLREDGVGVRVSLSKSDGTLANITYSYGKDLVIKYTTMFLNDYWNIGYKGLMYTGIKGKYASYLGIPGKGPRNGAIYLQTITNGIFDTPTLYFKDINQEESTISGSGVFMPSSFCAFEDVVWVNFNWITSTKSGILIKKGYTINENQRFYWKESEKKLYLNKNGEFHSILTDTPPADMSNFVLKSECNLSSISHNHRNTYCEISSFNNTCTDINSRVSAQVSRLDALKKRVEALTPITTSKEGYHDK